MTSRLLFLVGIFLVASLARVSADTFVVTNSSDSGPGSLRQAITDANAHPNSSDVDIIAFTILGAGVLTITTASALPDITEGVRVDGWSQPGFQSTPLIELTAAPGLVADGLRLGASSITIRGLIINGFQTGILVEAPGSQVDPPSHFIEDHVIQGCYIGTDRTGTTMAPNNRGIVILGAWQGVIGGSAVGAGNLISGNLSSGITFDAHLIPDPPNPPDPHLSSNTVVQGNLIGTDVTGTSALPNGGDGVRLESAGYIYIGGSASAGNVITGNAGNGINIVLGYSNISGNFIGVAADGQTAIGNQQNGILWEVYNLR